jgi:phage tail protein X
MAQTVTAHAGETVDELIWRTAGLGPDALPAVLNANRGLCDLVTLPAGHAIILPALSSAAPTRPLTQLWS